VLRREAVVDRDGLSGARGDEVVYEVVVHAGARRAHHETAAVEVDDHGELLGLVLLLTVVVVAA
jgi:hypothetical protein